MTEPHDDLLEYFYFGFHRALVRYRMLTVQGWIATAIGAAGLLVFWRDGSGLFTFAVALGAAVAGLALVHQSVAALDQFVRVPFPKPPPGSCPPNIAAAAEESARLMEDIDRGGWQEAFAALRALEGMAERYSLPPIP